MKQFDEKLHIDVPPETAFGVVVDPAAQQSRFMKVEVVNETPDGVGTTLRYYYRVAGVRLGGGTYTYSEYVPGERFTWEFSGGQEMFVMGGSTCCYLCRPTPVAVFGPFFTQPCVFILALT